MWPVKCEVHVKCHSNFKMAFVVSQFVEQFEGEEQQDRLPLLLRLKKSQLIAVAEHYDCAVSSSKTKGEIQKVLIQYLVDEEILPEIEEDEDDEEDVGRQDQMLALKRLELEVKL